MSFVRRTARFDFHFDLMAYEIYLDVKGANHREASWHASKDTKDWVEGQDAPGLGLYAPL